MTITKDDLLLLLPGTKVIVTDCEANEHGNNAGCVCHLKGKTVTLGQRYVSGLVGTSTWHLEGHNQRVRLSEVTLLRE